MRGFSSTLIAALESDSVELVYFLEIEVDLTVSPQEVLRLHSSLGSITFDSKTFSGAGSLLSIDTLQETNKINPAPLKIALSAMSSDVTNIFFNTNHYRAPVKLWMGVLSDGALSEDPQLIFSGFLQNLEMQEGEEGGDMIQATAESELILFKRSRNVRYTDRQLQSEYSGDLGLQYLEFVSTARIVWRGKNNPLGSGGVTGIQNAADALNGAIGSR